MAAVMDITGQRFGRLVATERVGYTGSGSKWKCLCDCGNERSVYLCHLRSGVTLSCGCYARDKNTKHGLAKHPLRSRYYGMRGRCENPAPSEYRNYGARGVRVCDEWRTLKAFHDWAMASGFAPGLEIDRIDPDGDYSPANCRWVTPRQNSNNKRNNVYLTGRGFTGTISQCAARFGVKYTVLYQQLRQGKPLDEALDYLEARNAANDSHPIGSVA